MSYIYVIIGAILGIVIELALPLSEIIMQQVNDVLADPSISSDLGLSSLIAAFGIFTAFLLLPSMGGVVGFKIGSGG